MQRYELPKIDFFGHKVTRLILGGNPFGGHSYLPDENSSADMINYYTATNVLKCIWDAEAIGYGTFLPLADDFMLRLIHQYLNEGGKMNWIAQTHPPIDLKSNIRSIKAEKAIAVFHQGTMTDNLVEAGKINELRDNIKILKDSELPVGISTHVPETLLRAEEEDWGLDFYMACVHNMRKRQRYESSFITGKKQRFDFYEEDRRMMFKEISRVQKPVIAFKVLSGGNRCGSAAEVESAFKETYENIKPIDMAVVGIFQKYRNQLLDDAEIVSRLLLKA